MTNIIITKKLPLLELRVVKDDGSFEIKMVSMNKISVGEVKVEDILSMTNLVGSNVSMEGKVLSNNSVIFNKLGIISAKTRLYHNVHTNNKLTAEVIVTLTDGTEYKTVFAVPNSDVNSIADRLFERISYDFRYNIDVDVNKLNISDEDMITLSTPSATSASINYRGGISVEANMVTGDNLTFTLTKKDSKHVLKMFGDDEFGIVRYVLESNGVVMENDDYGEFNIYSVCL